MQQEIWNLHFDRFNIGLPMLCCLCVCRHSLYENGDIRGLCMLKLGVDISFCPNYGKLTFYNLAILACTSTIIIMTGSPRCLLIWYRQESSQLNKFYIQYITTLSSVNRSMFRCMTQLSEVASQCR